MSVLEHIRRLVDGLDKTLFEEMIPYHVVVYLRDKSDKEIMEYLSTFFGYSYNGESTAEWLQEFEENIVACYFESVLEDRKQEE